MRNYYRKQCLETIELIKEIHAELSGRIVEGNLGDIMQLLGDCQQGAISIGTVIDAQEGEGSKTVGLLEEYCEKVFRFHEALCQNPADFQVMEKMKMLGYALEKAEKSFLSEVGTQYEVVFLPYKASMWDALESVWKKAITSSDKTAYVIPIPYYDKNPDGSFREFHYEGDLFPREVPVISYKDYDFETRHPDKIYIHNPYDAANYVTSVHPFFYSDKLKNYTDELIYIPYFVLNDEFDPEDDVVLDSLEHFVTVPAVVNADKVIVQSDTMKKAYVNIMVRHVGENTRQYWDRKILGEGSPKVEKIKSLRAEDYILPKEWEKLLTKPDGKRKKMILYNTSVSVILNSEQKMLEKIRDVLKLFFQEKDEVVLLWRPHPLTEATLQSMRPELYEEYRRIVEDYKSAGWGIYDDSPDMDRALVVSDAYYGDNSSLVWLYKVTGKPIMIQNCDILCEDQEEEETGQ